MEYEVEGPRPRGKRGPGQRLSERTVKLVNSTKRMPWIVVMVLLCSLAVLDPRVGHTMDVLSLFIPVLCHSD